MIYFLGLHNTVEMSSEDEITSPLKRKRVITDRDDMKERTPIKNDTKFQNTVSRSSERLRKKANRTFQLPTRDEVWKDIPPSTTPNKILTRCKPRRLVNNLVKERHRYNFDPDISSGDESIQDFIDDDEDDWSDVSDTDSENEKQTRKRRIKNIHYRIKAESCSEEEGDEEREHRASSPESRSYQHLDTNSSSFARKRKSTSQGKTPKAEKKRKEEEIVPFSGSDTDSNSQFQVKTSVRKSNKIESSDTESYSDSLEHVPKRKSKGNFSDKGHKKRKSANAAISDTESESVIIDTVSSESEQSLTKMKSKVQNSEQLQSDSTGSSFDVATVTETDLNLIRSVDEYEHSVHITVKCDQAKQKQGTSLHKDEHADLARTADYISNGDSGESIVESVNESRGSSNESSDDDGNIIKSTHRRLSHVIYSDDDDAEFSNPAAGSSNRKSSRAEDQIKIKSEARKNLFEEFKAARKRSLSGDDT